MVIKVVAAKYSFLTLASNYRHQGILGTMLLLRLMGRVLLH
jgi:hypothetical protein